MVDRHDIIDAELRDLPLEPALLIHNNDPFTCKEIDRIPPAEPRPSSNKEHNRQEEKKTPTRQPAALKDKKNSREDQHEPDDPDPDMEESPGMPAENELDAFVRILPAKTICLVCHFNEPFF